MDVVSHCALPVAGRVWKPRAGAHALTFVCKATFTLAPGKLALAPDQQPIHEFDRPWSESVTSLYAASDLAPRKLRADVVLVGNAYAPGGVPTRKLVARLVTGDVDKSIEVWCDRTLRADGSVAEGVPFAKVPLLYERAAGGPGTENPVGMTLARDAYGGVALPNLTLPGARGSLDTPMAPAGFGPIAPEWPGRRVKLGRAAETFSEDAWNEEPLPADLDMTYFDSAPADQQLGALEGDERIVLENLHSAHAQLAMTLPGLRPRAKVTGPAGERTVPMRADTLWIDTSREICCLTYRGQVVLASPKDAGWVVVMLETADSEAAAADLDGTVDGNQTISGLMRPAQFTMPFQGKSDPRPMSGLPFQATGAPPPPLRRSDAGSGLPFRPEGLGSSSVSWPTPSTLGPPIPPPAPSQPGGMQLPPPSALGKPSALVSPVGPPPPPPQPPPPPLSQSVAAPLMVAPISLPVPVAPSVSDSPWAVAPSVAGVGTIAPVAPAASAAAAARPEPVRAAPASAPRPMSIRERSETLDLVFYDTRSLPRIRRMAAWKKLLAELDDRAIDDDEDDPNAAEDPAVIEDRRGIFEVLVRGDASDAASVEEALGRAVRDDGRFYPPLLLLAGELSTPFDEVETLKSTITTVTPLIGNDEGLRASVQVAKDFLVLPTLASAPAVTEGLTTRVRDAWNGGKRTVPAGYLDAQTERALLEQRAYQKRKVLGGLRQRALFHFVPVAQGAAPIPAYLPDDLATKLPMFARFKVRMVVRMHLPLDQFEQSPMAFEALAMARLVAVPKRTS